MASTTESSFFLWKLSVIFPGLTDTTLTWFPFFYLSSFSPLQLPSWALSPLANELPRDSLLGPFQFLPFIMSPAILFLPFLLITVSSPKTLKCTSQSQASLLSSKPECVHRPHFDHVTTPGCLKFSMF